MTEKEMENELSADQIRKKHLRFSDLLFLIVALFIIGAVITAFVIISQRELRIAFMSDRDGNNEIYIMEKDGKGAENISNNEAQDGLPNWSAKKRSIVFLSTRESTSASIYRMNVFGSGLEALVTDMPIVATIPKWSPDGKWIAFDSGLSGTSDVYLINVKTGELKNLTDHPSSDRFYDWSPDSKNILLVSTREDTLTGNPCLYTLGIDENSELVKLTEPDSANVWASWSPDGDKIAFTSDRDGNAEIYVMDSDGGNLTRLTENQKFDGFPIWSPDGSRIAYISLDVVDEIQNPEIYVMNSDGSDQKNISNHPAQDGFNWEFYWSPDSSQILFTTDRDGNLEIYLMDADGGNQTNLTNNPANDNYPTWVQ
jgi:Tol biopolymer transport system component